MTPDHTHAAISIAALNKGMNVIVHKPLANRVLEARAVVELARARKIATHFLPASEGTGQRAAIEMVRNGAIGTLREIHNWSVRPMWPQFSTLPTDAPPVPAGFDWTLWLGPSLDRPYHPNYTHTNFRGWYEFGGGSIADMGHYSLWPVFQLLNLDAPVSVESTPSHVCTVVGDVCQRIRNDYSFPAACTVRMRFAPKGDRAGLDIFWYDGGIKPPVPEELMAENKEFAEEGMLLVGDRGKILGGFRAENPQVIPESKMRAYRVANNIPDPAPAAPGAGAGRARRPVAEGRGVDRGVQGRACQLRRLHPGRADLRRRQPGRHIAAARRKAARLGRRRGEDHERPGGGQVPDTGVQAGLGSQDRDDVSKASRPCER